MIMLKRESDKILEQNKDKNMFDRDMGNGQDKESGPGSRTKEICVCPACGTMVTQKLGIPCEEMGCPNCGAKMRKEKVKS